MRHAPSGEQAAPRHVVVIVIHAEYACAELARPIDDDRVIGQSGSFARGGVRGEILLCYDFLFRKSSYGDEYVV